MFIAGEANKYNPMTYLPDRQLQKEALRREAWNAQEGIRRMRKSRIISG